MTNYNPFWSYNPHVPTCYLFDVYKNETTQLYIAYPVPYPHIPASPHFYDYENGSEMRFIWRVSATDNYNAVQQAMLCWMMSHKDHDLHNLYIENQKLLDELKKLRSSGNSSNDIDWALDKLHFSEIPNKEKLKQRHKRLSLICHTDKGGANNPMGELNKARDIIKKYLNNR
ncbi:hypothetical protein ID858_15940 [Xenorhabdus sp. DI]|uniref:hypothetical protein n=1 Tax=Xenorhabdus doucetiae TaxID=351671 RepID=UPI001985EE77|nr:MULTISPECIES: hypothetical protein [unclassified Xenorhabdus]MBD2783800.1 hypothetical protein [Xenorhabdus sp. 3]MBD2789987.1 hypothetical protein [Xenorhabdus sp. DI]